MFVLDRGTAGRLLSRDCKETPPPEAGHDRVVLFRGAIYNMCFIIIIIF